MAKKCPYIIEGYFSAGQNLKKDRIATWMSKYKAEHDGKSVDIYNRLREKEQIMLNAIENQVLEKVTSTEEDLDLIFSGLGLA